MYVKDTVKGFLEIARAKEFAGEAVNLGTGVEISIKDLALKIATLLNKKVRIASERVRVRGKKTEVERLCCDNTKVTSETCWKPEYDLDAGLRETIAWMKKNVQYYKAHLYNV
jgi:nucleoside-diphosphate-sugar epimerase